MNAKKQNPLASLHSPPPFSPAAQLQPKKNGVAGPGRLGAPPVYRPQSQNNKTSPVQPRTAANVNRPQPLPGTSHTKTAQPLLPPPVYRPAAPPAILRSTPPLFPPRLPVAAQRAAVVQPSGRFYQNSEINEFVEKRKEGESLKVFTKRFKQKFQFHHRNDLRYFRMKAWNVNPATALAPYPDDITYPLADNFDEHVLGDVEGVGWHTERSHENGEEGYSYDSDVGEWGWIAQSKGTYWVSNVVIKGEAKSGNNGRSTFFPKNLTIGAIRYDARYVANTYAKNGQIVRGRGPYTGIMIDCLINNDKVESAYPYKPGW